MDFLVIVLIVVALLVLIVIWKTAVVVQQLHRRWVRGESTDPRMARIADRMPSLIAAAIAVLDEAGI